MMVYRKELEHRQTAKDVTEIATLFLVIELVWAVEYWIQANRKKLATFSTNERDLPLHESERIQCKRLELR